MTEPGLDGSILVPGRSGRVVGGVNDVDPALGEPFRTVAALELGIGARRAVHGPNDARIDLPSRCRDPADNL